MMNIENPRELSELDDNSVPKNVLDMTQEQLNKYLKDCEANGTKVRSTIKQEMEKIKKAKPEELTKFTLESGLQKFGCDGCCGNTKGINLKSCLSCDRIRKIN